MSPAGPGSSPLWPAASLHAGCSRRKSNTDDFIILPSDLSGILSCSPPPPSSLPPPTDTYTLLLYILPHCISRSPCLSFHHTPSRPILPHFPAPLPTPRAFFIAKFNTHFKVKCQCVCVCAATEKSAELRPVPRLLLHSFGSSVDQISSLRPVGPWLPPPRGNTSTDNQ